MGQIETQRSGYFSWYSHPKNHLIYRGTGYRIVTDENEQGGSHLELIFYEIDENKQTEVDRLLKVTVPDAKQKIRLILQKTSAGPVRTHKIFGAWGTPWDRVQSGSQFDEIQGQLQMTVGINMSDLPGHVSGKRATNYIDQARGLEIDENEGASLQLFQGYSPDPRGSIWNDALTCVNADNKMNSLGNPQKKQLAAVLAALANVPLSARNDALPYPKAAAGKLLARSDFAAIVNALPNDVKSRLTRSRMRKLLLQTLNMTDPTISAQDPVFPATTDFTYIKTPTDLSAVSIGDWAESVAPRHWSWWNQGYVLGIGSDLLTKKNFPGTEEQKNSLESMGGFGAKLDPGGKPIWEFRGLGMTPLKNLEQDIERCLGYLMF